MADPWVKFFPSDWLGGTRTLSASEKGVYIDLLSLMYEHEEPLPRDDRRLARLCGVRTVTFRRITERLIELGKVVQVDGNRLWNARVCAEISARSLRSKKAASNATKRWASSLGKTEQDQGPPDATASNPHAPEHRSSIGTDMLRTRAPEPEPEPEPDKKEDDDDAREGDFQDPFQDEGGVPGTVLASIRAAARIAGPGCPQPWRDHQLRRWVDGWQRIGLSIQDIHAVATAVAAKMKGEGMEPFRGTPHAREDDGPDAVSDEEWEALA